MLQFYTEVILGNKPKKKGKRLKILLLSLNIFFVSYMHFLLISFY